MIGAFAGKFGSPQESADGCLTSGGAEANLTALLCALTDDGRGSLTRGANVFPAKPVFYASDESHHSFLKAARTVGLGSGRPSNRPVTDDLQMDIDALRQMIEQDRGLGYEPFLIIGTAGSTSAGVVDPLSP